MQTIYEIDKNFCFDSNIDIPGIRFYDVLQHPFSVHGVFHEGGMFPLVLWQRPWSMYWKRFGDKNGSIIALTQ